MTDHYSKHIFSEGAMIITLDASEANPSDVERLIHQNGICIIQNVIALDVIEQLQKAMYEVQSIIRKQVGTSKLSRAGEVGILRIPMHYHHAFYHTLENEIIVSIVDKLISPNAILHLQNGFILPSSLDQHTKKRFQNQFHMDFKRVLNGYLCSLNILVVVSDFTAQNGGTLAVPGSHQMTVVPDASQMERAAKAVEANKGSVVVFDSTLWHCAGRNQSNSDRLAINHQFTYAYFKQQIVYVRALGAEAIASLPERTQQMLGWYSRVPTSLDEYYVAPDQRLYRPNQE